MSALLNQKELYQFNQIVAELYNEEDAEKAILSFFEKLHGLLYFDKGDVCLFKEEKEIRNCELFIVVGWSDMETNNYLSKYYTIDDTVPILTTNQPIMFRCADIFIESEREKNQYVSEFLLPSQIKHSIEGNLFLSDDGCLAGVAVHRSASHKDFSQKELEIMKLFRPHLANIVKGYKRSGNKENVYQSMIPFFFDMKDIGIIIWDFDLNLVDSNLTRNDFISTEHREELMRSMLALCRNFKKTILNKGSSEGRVKSRVNMGIKSYFVDISYSPIAKGGKGSFVGIVYDYAGILIDILHELQKKFSLTEREFEVLECMVRGMSNLEIAKKLIITIPTVKKHLANIYSKMEIEGKHQIINTLL